ncbi:WD40 repeat-like protein [Dimargaris cristalligena]|nr:WD40 repeat-like protein [Dimargaris cristalligena]
MSAIQKFLLAPNPPTTRGQAVRLTADPKGDNIVYANGKSIFVRQLGRPELATEYLGHRGRTTMARFSPSGYYVASGDMNGTVRVWDATQEEHLLKNEVAVISGPVQDIAWDSESKRIMAVGNGKDRYGHVFLFDTGNSVGEVTGHSKGINACTMRPSGRPFRAATASDDGTVVFYHGAPYKYQRAIQDHAGFVNDVRYSPNGDVFVSVGSDKRIFMYDGKTGDQVADVSKTSDSANDLHTGGIYSVSWSGDSRQFMTSSGDGTVRLWDVETGRRVQTFTFNQYGDHRDQQVGNLWSGEHLVSLGLSGDLFFLDPRADSLQLKRTLHGHQRAIMASAMTPESTLFTGDSDGRIFDWHFDADLLSLPAPVSGTGHKSQIIALAAQGAKVVSASMDDVARPINVSPTSAEYASEMVVLGSQPKQLAVLADGSSLVVGQTNELLHLSASGESIQHRYPLEFTPSAVHVLGQGDQLLVGFTNNQAHIYHGLPTETEGGDGGDNKKPLSPAVRLENNRSPVTCVRLSPNGELAAVADTQGKILVYQTATGQLSISHWVFHTARVNAIEWRSDSKFLASGSLDSHVYVWSVERPMKKIAIKNAHLGGVSGAHFYDNTHLITTGANGSVRMWDLEYPA